MLDKQFWMELKPKWPLTYVLSSHMSESLLMLLGFGMTG